MNGSYYKSVLRCFKLVAKKTILFSLLFIFYRAARGQEAELDSLQQQFNHYGLKAFQEKIYVHTDKTFYVAGEILWFKVYNVDGYFNKPLILEKVAYVEVMDSNKKPVLQGKIELKEGSGNGSFILPYSLASGSYQLRAYTNWMKNFSPDFYFEQPLTIVNTLKKPKWQEPEAPPQYSIQFFPEGGNLVYGLQSKVAFKVTDQYGKGKNCKGVIVDQNGDTIISFRSQQFGRSHFPITPAKGTVYKAIITVEDGKDITGELPAVYSEGYVMQLMDNDSGYIQINVNSNVRDGNAPMYLLAQTRQVIKSAQVQVLQDGRAQFLIDKDKLGEGISQVTLFNSARQPVCERLYFKQPAKKLAIAIKKNSETYSLREKVILDLAAADQEGRPVMADLSLSVVLLDSLPSLDQTGIHAYLWLSSDVKGPVESADYYFNNRSEETDQAMDDLMLTQGWRRFKWEEVLGSTTPSFQFLPEYEGLTVNGRIINKSSNSPGKNIIAYLTLPGNHFSFSCAGSNENGWVQFPVKEVYGSNQMIVQTNFKTDSNYRIEIVNPYSQNFSVTPVSPFHISQTWSTQLSLRNIQAQVQHTYLKKEQQYLLPQRRDTSSFFGKPDKTYQLDEFTRFSTMEEVMREYVAEVRIRKQDNGFHFQVKNTPYETFFEKAPLILIDGLPVFDLNQIIAFDPLKIKKLDVMARKYYTASVANAGIVSYQTYEGDLGGFELNPNALLLEYEALQLKRVFYSPQHESIQQSRSRQPDYRNVLYWSTDIKINEGGKGQVSFYTSDLPGRYAVVVQGITAKGEAGSVVFPISVIK